MVVEFLLNNQCINDGEDDGGLFGVVLKELLVDLIHDLSELVDTKLGSEKEFIDESGYIWRVIIH